MVLRPGSKIRTTTVSSRRGEVHTPFSCRLPFLVPSKSKAPQQAISLAPWLASGVMVLPGRHRWWSGPARPPARAPGPTTVTANQLQADGRFKQAITSRSRQGPPCLMMRPSQDGWGAVMSLRRARRWRWGLLPGPDSLPGCSRRWSHRPARPGRAPRSRPWGRSAADVPKRWALTPASFAAPGRCSRAFPIQPRRD